MPAAGISISIMAMTITTDHRPLLHLLAWLSPAFPTGGFAYSHGLEWAVEVGDIRDRETLLGWLADVVAHGSGRSDVVLLRHAHRAGSDVDTLQEIAALARAATLTRERWDEALAQGRAFCMAVAAWAGSALTDDLPYAVAVGVAAGRAGVPEDAVAAAYLQAFATTLISSALRLVPLGQTAGLRVLAALEETIVMVVDETRDTTLFDVGGCALRSDMAAMRHETQYTRLFRS